MRVVEESLNLVANQLRVGQIELRTDFASSPVWIMGNGSLLEQLVTNLVLNAAHAMPRKGAHIDVMVDVEKEAAILRILDNGKGIPAADLPKVFDPFFTTMPVGQGTGLGLSISYSIVQQHGGTIEISSQEGEGTVVTVSLPFHLEEAS